MYAVLEELPPASGALDAVLRRRWQDTARELDATMGTQRPQDDDAAMTQLLEDITDLNTRW